MSSRTRRCTSSPPLTTITSAGFIFGELILATEAYLIRDYFTLQLVAHVPLALITMLYFVFPESIRWLVNKDRFEEAKRELRKAAEINGKPEPTFKSKMTSPTQVCDICIHYKIISLWEVVL